MLVLIPCVTVLYKTSSTSVTSYKYSTYLFTFFYYYVLSKLTSLYGNDM